jgi:DNA-binding NarL/FixJ family response regulator
MKHKIVIFEDKSELSENMNDLFQLTDTYEVVGIYPNGIEAVNVVKKLNPDFIVMDIDMPFVNGIDAVSNIRKHNVKVQILMLTVFDDNLNVFNAMKAGANGYLLKKHIGSKLLEAIEDLKEGGAPMSPSIARMVINQFHTFNAIKNYELTKRETDILRELSLGNSYKMISENLFISHNTVRTHIKNIYEKLQVNSQTEAVSKALNEKLV